MYFQNDTLLFGQYLLEKSFIAANTLHFLCRSNRSHLYVWESTANNVSFGDTRNTGTVGSKTVYRYGLLLDV